jgi:hypothetical protein
MLYWFLVNRTLAQSNFAGLALRCIILAALGTNPVQAHGHGGGGGGGGDNQSSHWHDGYHHQGYYDPFWQSWYPGYSGNYDSDYYYAPTPAQKAEAERKIREYLAAVKKGKKQSARHRYVAVQTLRPTKKQLQDYVSKRAKAKSQAASGTQISNRWVDPDQLRCVMVFDTGSKQFVGSGCYVVASVPTAGTTARFETFTAEFVGG